MMATKYKQFSNNFPRLSQKTMKVDRLDFKSWEEQT